MRILFVCTGNIHRSALAEAILRALARREGRSDLEASSAGVMAVTGMAVARSVEKVASDAGLDLSTHRSRPVTAQWLSGAESILVMERFHLEWIAGNHPAALDRCAMLSHYGSDVTRAAGIEPGEDVPDADGADPASFHRSFAIIEECVQRLFRALPPAPQEIYAGAIEERFRTRRRTPLTLSPADFGLVERWWSRGVPLWIVLDSIDDLFRKKEAMGEPSRVRHLSFVKDEVEERFEMYERSRSGAARIVTETVGEASALLCEAALRLRDAADTARRRGRDDAAAIFERVAASAGAVDGDELEDAAAARLRLHDLEEELLALFRQLAGGDELTRLHEQAVSHLAAYRERMTASAFEATVTRLIAERIKDLYEVPDLTKF